MVEKHNAPRVSGPTFSGQSLIRIAAALAITGLTAAPVSAGDRQGNRWGIPAPTASIAVPQPAYSAASNAPRQYASVSSHSSRPVAVPSRANAAIVDWRTIAHENDRARTQALQPVAHGSMPLLSGVPVVPYSHHQKVGRPYKVAGRVYVPARQDDYDMVGVASWYGPKFHGRSTSNGETFDKNLYSAAHPTLPIPSFVQVDNLENGTSLVVRVNDRGPFVDGRMIDLSQAAARALGFEAQGTANVRVRYLGAAPQADTGDRYPVAASAGQRRHAAPQAAPVHQPAPSIQRVAYQQPLPKPVVDPFASTLDMQAYPDDPNQKFAMALSKPRVAPSGHFVQVASFSTQERAAGVVGEFQAVVPGFVQPAFVAERTVYRVMAGPFRDADTAEGMRRTLTQMGYRYARVTFRD